VPSKAQFIQITPYATVPPRGSITSSPAGPDISISAGGKVNFSTTTSAAKYSWVFPGGTPATSTVQNPGDVTFATAGTYTASLTVLDASGNSDPHPPTRTITVNPATPDFSITVDPPAVEITPGGTASYTVSVTGLSGFNGPVTLTVGSESGFPGNIQSLGFSPSTINGSGTAKLTMSTTSATIPFAWSLTITGNSGSIAHTASTTLLVNLAPPANLSASAGNASVALSWGASVGASSYQVQRASVSGGPYRTLVCPTTTSYTDSAVVGGNTYYYVVSAAFNGNPNAGGASTDSTEAVATPQASPPAAPTGLTVQSGNAQVLLSWTPVSGVTGYNVKRATTSGGAYTVIASPTAASYTDTSVTNGITYYYIVSAVSGSVEGANSAEVSATPNAVQTISAPTNLTAKSNKPSTIDLQWVQSSTSAVTNNSIYRRLNTGSYGPSPIATIPAGTSYRDAVGNKGSTFCYKITATGPAGTSAFSNEACTKVK
jgi:fibronectin type 3 domain-containing protein